MNREVHVRLREGLRGRFPRPTRLSRQDYISDIPLIPQPWHLLGYLRVLHKNFVLQNLALELYIIIIHILTKDMKLQSVNRMIFLILFS